MAGAEEANTGICKIDAHRSKSVKVKVALALMPRAEGCLFREFKPELVDSRLMILQ